ncbi:hypothetical protein ACWD4L_44670 [Streptomyces sp. NPDC002596]
MRATGARSVTDAQLRIMVERHGEGVAVNVAANPGTSPGLLEDLTRWLSLGRKLL